MAASHENRPGPRFRTLEGHLGRGVRRAFTIAAPAAGANWQTAVPGGRSWRLLLGRGTLTTSVAVANRSVGLEIGVQGLVVARIPSSLVVTAGLTVGVTYAMIPALADTGSTAAGLMVPVPPMVLPGGTTIGSYGVNLDAADQLSAVNLWIEEWYEDDQDIETHRSAEEADYLASVRQVLGVGAGQG